MSEEKKRTPARNDITGAYIESKPPTEEYRKGWERIWGSKDKPETKTNSLESPVVDPQGCENKS